MVAKAPSLKRITKEVNILYLFRLKVAVQYQAQLANVINTNEMLSEVMYNMASEVSLGQQSNEMLCCSRER